MDLVIIIKLSAAFLEMLDPIKACILNLQKKTFLHLTALYTNNKHTKSVYAIDVLLERAKHKLYTIICQHLMSLFLIHP